MKTTEPLVYTVHKGAHAVLRAVPQAIDSLTIAQYSTIAPP